MRAFLTSALLCSAALLCSCDGGKAGGSAGGASGTPAPAATTGDILIGHVASLTGDRAAFGNAADKGSRLAIEELNAAGGLLGGRKLTLKTENDQSKVGEPKLAIKKLISSDQVVAVLGEVASSASIEMAPVAQEAQIPMVSPASTAERVTQKGDYIFRACFTNSFQGMVMSKFALAKGWKKVAILTETTSDYSVSLSETFKKHFTQNGGTITVERTYATKDKDFSGALAAVKAGADGQAPDAIFVPGYYNEVALIALQAKQAGLNAPLLGGDGWRSNSLIEVAGPAIEGQYFCDHLVTDAFTAKFKAKYGEEPDSMAALGYDAAQLLAAAIKQAGTTDGAKVRDALAKTRDFPGASGTITLDQDRNAVKPAAIMTIKDGKFVQTSVVQP